MKINEAVAVLSNVPGQRAFRAGLVTAGVGAVGVAATPWLYGTSFGTAAIPGTMTAVASAIGFLSKGMLVVGGVLVLKGAWDGIQLGVAALAPVPSADKLRQELSEQMDLLRDALAKIETMRQEAP